jgi:hypothetical protein
MIEELASKVTVLSGVVYGLVEVFKPIWDPTKREQLGDKATAAVLGVGLSVMAGVDLFPVVGLPLAVPYVGSILTGFLIVGGGKGIHDILGAVNAFRTTRASGPPGVNG